MKEEIGTHNLVCNMNSCLHLQIKGRDHILTGIDITVSQTEVVTKNMMRCRHDTEKIRTFIGSVIQRIFLASVKFSITMIRNMIVIQLLLRTEDRVHIAMWNLTLGGDTKGTCQC